MRKENLGESFGWQINKLPSEIELFGMSLESLEVHVFPLKLDGRLSHFAPDRLSVLWVGGPELISAGGGIIENTKLLNFNTREEVKNIEKLHEFVMFARKTKGTIIANRFGGPIKLVQNGDRDVTKKLWGNIRDLLNEEDGLMLDFMGVVELREKREGKSRVKVRKFLVINPEEVKIKKEWFTESMGGSTKKILGAKIFFKGCWGVFGEEYGELTDVVLGVMAEKRARELSKEYRR